MRRNRAAGPRSLLVVAILAGAGGPAAVHAQTIPSPYRFIEPRQETGVFAGYLGVDRGRFDLGPEAGLLLGARYGVRISGGFALEGTLSLLPTTRDLVDPRRAEGDRVIGETDATVLTADVRLRFTLTGQRTWNGLAPHVAVGGGFATDLAADPPLEGDDRFANQRFDLGTPILGLLGGGVRWYPSERFVVRSDALLQLWKLPIPEGFRNLDPTRGAPPDEWASGLNVSVGVSYVF